MADDMLPSLSRRRNYYRAYVVRLFGEVKYVGVTKATVKQRWSGHICDSNNEKRVRALGRAIKKYGPENFTIEEVANAFDDDSLDDLETILIAQYKTMRNGYNLTTGGKRRHSFSEKSLALMKVVHRGFVHSAESRQKMSDFRRGKVRSPETNAKMVAIHQGRKRSPETRQKISESKKNMSAESRARISAGQMGKKMSAASVAKVAAALRGRKLPPRSAAHCAAISQAKRMRDVAARYDGRQRQLDF